jgi:hypothetical protein
MPRHISETGLRGSPPETVRELAAAALDDDFPDVLEALRRGLRDKSAATAARTAIAYVQLVYGRQLQQKEDERTSTDPLDVQAMTREERQAWKARLLAEDPSLVDMLGVAEPSV